jgi:hypothetical protein
MAGASSSVSLTPEAKEVRANITTDVRPFQSLRRAVLMQFALRLFASTLRPLRFRCGFAARDAQRSAKEEKSNSASCKSSLTPRPLKQEDGFA